MSDENKFWLGIWSFISVVLIAAIAAGTYSGYHQRTAMQNMVEKGVDPMVVSCSFGVSQSEQGICTLLASKIKELK